MGDADAGENVGDDGAACAIHGVDAELHAGFGDQAEVGKALNGCEIGRQEIDEGDRRRFVGTRDRLAQVGLDFGDDGRLAGASVPGLVLDAVPLRRIVRRGYHDAAGGFASANSETERRSGRDVVGKRHGDAGCRDNFSAGVGKGFRPEAGVVADAKAFGGVFVRSVFAGVNVGCHGLCGNADVGKGEVVGDDAAPAIGTKLDLRMRHLGFFVLPGE